MKIEALPYSKTHGHPRTPGLVDNRQAELQALAVMTEFWKRPKFWIGAIIILWLGYLLTANLTQPVEIYIVPHFIHRTVTAAAVMIIAAMVGSLLTLIIQFAWRKRSSKNAVASPATPVSSSSTVA
jgi:hypothetical protein